MVQSINEWLEGWIKRILKVKKYRFMEGIY